MAPVDPKLRKAEIVAAAFGLVAGGGIEAATMRRIATAAGATTGRVTHYFDSRVDVLVAVLVAVLVEVDRRRQARVALHAGLEPSARLRAVLHERLALDSQRVDEQRVWVALSTTDIPELRDELARQPAEWDHLVGSLIDDVRGMPADDTTALAIVATVEGLSLRLMADCTPRTRRDAEWAIDDALRANGLAS